jgi:hypothetical protein
MWCGVETGCNTHRLSECVSVEEPKWPASTHIPIIAYAARGQYFSAVASNSFFVTLSSKYWMKKIAKSHGSVSPHWIACRHLRGKQTCSWDLDCECNITCLRFIQLILSLFKIQLNGDTNRLCGLVVRVPGYRSRSPGFDSRRYQIFWTRRLLCWDRKEERLLCWVRKEELTSMTGPNIVCLPPHTRRRKQIQFPRQLFRIPDDGQSPQTQWFWDVSVLWNLWEA